MAAKKRVEMIRNDESGLRSLLSTKKYQRIQMKIAGKTDNDGLTSDSSILRWQHSWLQNAAERQCRSE